MFFFEATENDLRRFVSPSDLKKLLERRYKHDSFSLNRMILFFDTTTQHSWFAVSSKRFCCIIDQRKEPSPRVIWQIPIDDIVCNGKLNIEIDIDQVSYNKGFIKIGNEKVRKFSTSLFDPESLRKKLRGILLENAHLNN